MLRILLAVLVLLNVQAETRPIVYGVPARITSLNPYLISGIESFTVTGFVIEPLAQVDPFSQSLRPWLAKSWKVNQKKKTVTVTLREGVTFHNGQPLTSADVQFTWQSYFNPEYKSEIWKPMWEGVESIEVIDDLNFTVQLKTLSYQSLQNFMTVLRILPKSIYSKMDTKVWASNLTGTGPFQVKRFESGRVLELAPNENWWGWKAFNQKVAPPVLVKSVPDAKLAEQMRLKNELDVYMIPSGEMLPKTGVTSLDSPFGRGISLGLNLKIKELQDPRVREALLLLWDRQALNQKIYDGRFEVSVDGYSTTTTFYPKGKAIPYDPKKAIDLLKKAGFGISHPLSLKILTNAESERWVSLYQADAAKVGVKITVERVVDENQWWKLVKDGKFELLTGDGSASQKPNRVVLHSQGSYNASGIADKKLDDLLDKLDQEFNENRREVFYREIILYVRNLRASVPGLHSSKIHFLLSPQVTVDRKDPLAAWRWSLRK